MVYSLLVLIIIITEAKSIHDYDQLSDVLIEDSKNTAFTVWDPELEARYKNSNQAYLINYTAAWCITCQANDKIALSKPPPSFLSSSNLLKAPMAIFSKSPYGVK